jgi:HEAT repeat protein
VLGLATWLVERLILQRWLEDHAVALAASMGVVLTLLILILTVALFGMKHLSARRTRAEERILPQILDTVVAIAGGTGSLEELRSAHSAFPSTVERVLASSLAAQTGPGYERLAAAAEICGVVERWKAETRHRSAARRCEAVLRLATLPFGTATTELEAALEDSEELVSAEAGRALLAKGTVAEAEVVFDALHRRSLLVQALNLASLRRHAAGLGAGAIPRAFRSGDEDRILVALRAVTAWRRLLSVDEIAQLFVHPSPEVRTAAFGAVPFLLTADSLEAALRQGLADESQSVRAAAAAAAGRKGMSALRSALLSAVAGGGEAGREAARALTLLGGAAAGDLETCIRDGQENSALALEALERYRLGRVWI